MYLFVMRPAGLMLCSSRASGPPFWMSDIPGHMVTNETYSSPLCRSCGLIPDMHLPNYYETEWINLLDVESICMYVVIITLLVLPGGLGWAFLNLHRCSPGTGNSDTQRQEWSCVRMPTKWSYTHSPWHHCTSIKLANHFILIIGSIPS